MSKKYVWNPFRKAYWTKENLLRDNRKQKTGSKEIPQRAVITRAKPIRTIAETKNTCVACGNVWYYGKEDVWQNRADKMESFGNSMQSAGKSMMCCSGCVPALFIPEKQGPVVKDLNKCEKCGSSAVKQEQVTHIVE